MARVADKICGRPIVLVTDNLNVARLAAMNITRIGANSVAVLAGGMKAWEKEGFALEYSPDVPSDENCKDHLFFTGKRHLGDKGHMRQYLDWEIGLIDQLDDEERAAFRLC